MLISFLYGVGTLVGIALAVVLVMPWVVSGLGRLCTRYYDWVEGLFR